MCIKNWSWLKLFFRTPSDVGNSVVEATLRSFVRDSCKVLDTHFSQIDDESLGISYSCVYGDFEYPASVQSVEVKGVRITLAYPSLVIGEMYVRCDGLEVMKVIYSRDKKPTFEWQQNTPLANDRILWAVRLLNLKLDELQIEKRKVTALSCRQNVTALAV